MNRDATHVSLARDALRQLGGRAHVSKVRKAFVGRLDAEERRLLEAAQMDRYVAGLLRRAGGERNLPWALSIKERYVQRPLLDLSERTALIKRYARQAGELTARAYSLAEETRDLFGVWINPAGSTDVDTAEAETGANP